MDIEKPSCKRDRGKGSVYPGATRSPNVSQSEARIWETVYDMISQARRPMSMNELSALNPVPEELPDLTDLLEAEAKRAMTDSRNRQQLIESAQRNIGRAYMISKVRNPLALARFAVELAYDNLFRMQISATLDETWIRRWRFTGKEFNCFPSYPDHGLPIACDKLPLLKQRTECFAGETFSSDNLIEPFEGLKPTYGWSIDPARPPVSSIRAASALINGTFAHQPINVLAVELGHNVAAEALAYFVPRSTVHTVSTVFPTRTQSVLVSDFEAVVLGIPNAACLEFVVRAIDPDHPLSRWDCDRFWKYSRGLQPACIQQLVQFSMSKVASGCLLILIGDIESGCHHAANSMVANSGGYSPVAVGGQHHPVVFRYRSPPWGPFGVIPPTHRMISAWRRTA